VGRWEAVIGARWWSMDRAGLHILGLDWFSALSGVDLDAQLAFAEADLGRLERGAPVLVLSHDQPDEGWLDHLRGVAPGVRLAGVLTGHCHAPKTVTAPDSCLHVSTGSSTVGGLDWSPPQLRLLEWDGTTLSAGPPERPLPPPPRPAVFAAPAPGWPVWELGAGQHLGAVVAGGDRLLVPVVEADLRSGAVVAIDPAAGPRWRHRLDGSPVTGLATDGEAIVAVGLGGEVRCMSADDGVLRWRDALGDPVRSRVLAAPVLAPGGLVVAGDLWSLAAHELGSGRRRWIRRDLGPVDTLMTYGSGVATASSVVLPFGGPHRGLTSVALDDGTVEWTDARRTPPPLSSVVDLGDGDAVVVRDGPLVERFALATGEVRWRARLRGRFSTAAPLHRDGTLTVVTGDGVLHRLDAGSGAVLHRRRLDGVRPGYGPYRTGGTGAPTVPVVVGDRTVIVLIDGSVWALADGDGAPEPLGDLGAEVTAQPAAFGGTLAAVDRRGRIHLLATAGAALPRGEAR
jgi:outer membrane protein assembly factor BamB